jgi:hypothetical protein
MSRPSKAGVWKAIKKYRLLVAGLAVIVLFLTAWQLLDALSEVEDQTAKEKFSAFISVIFNLGSSIIAFVVVALLFSDEDKEAQAQTIQDLVSEELGKSDTRQSQNLRKALTEIVGRSNNLESVNWKILIDGAAEIDFVVQGWDGWFERGEISSPLRDFFERGGVFRLYIYKSSTAENSYCLEEMAKRLDRAPALVVAEIQKTHRNLHDIHAQIENCRGRIEVFETTDLIWYFAARFRDKQLDVNVGPREAIVFSVYSHTGQRPWRLPAVTVYPDAQSGNISQWFDKEISHLSSTAKSNSNLKKISNNEQEGK